MESESLARRFDRCPVCGRGFHGRQTMPPPSGPCPLCSTTRDFQALAGPGLLPFATAVLPELRASTMRQALNEIVDDLVAGRRLGVSEGRDILQSLGRHEPVVSTEIGCGVALICARDPDIRRVLGAVARSDAGVELGIPDAQPVHLIFLIISPARQPGLHLFALQAIARYLRASRSDPQMIQNGDKFCENAHGLGAFGGGAVEKC